MKGTVAQAVVKKKPIDNSVIPDFIGEYEKSWIPAQIQPWEQPSLLDWVQPARTKAPTFGKWVLRYGSNSECYKRCILLIVLRCASDHPDVRGPADLLPYGIHELQPFEMEAGRG